MKVNQSSWHYRWFEFVHDFARPHFECLDAQQPRSLCGYFWGFWFANARFLLLMAMIAVLVSFLPTLFWSWLVNHSIMAGGFLKVLGCVLGGLAVVFSLIGLLSHLFTKAEIAKARRAEAGDRSLTGTEVFLETLSAKKQKICPRIEYVKE